MQAKAKFSPDDEGTSADDHALVCRLYRRREVTARHNALNHLLRTQCNRAGVPAGAEPPPANVLNEKRLRPDGWQHFASENTLTDTTVRHPVVQATLKRKTLAPSGHVLVGACRDKHRRYDELADKEASKFHPLALESYGTFSPGYITFLKKITGAAVASGLATGGSLNVPAGDAYMTRLVQETSICLLIGNSWILTRFARESTKGLHPRLRPPRRRRQLAAFDSELDDDDD